MKQRYIMAHESARCRAVDAVRNAPAGTVSAVSVLRQTYGDRLDWDDLLEAFEERAGIAEFEGNETRQAAELIAADAVRKIVEARRARIAR